MLVICFRIQYRRNKNMVWGTMRNRRLVMHTVPAWRSGQGLKTLLIPLRAPSTIFNAAYQVLSKRPIISALPLISSLLQLNLLPWRRHVRRSAPIVLRSQEPMSTQSESTQNLGSYSKLLSTIFILLTETPLKGRGYSKGEPGGLGSIFVTQKNV